MLRIQPILWLLGASLLTGSSSVHAGEVTSAPATVPVVPPTLDAPAEAEEDGVKTLFKWAPKPRLKKTKSLLSGADGNSTDAPEAADAGGEEPLESDRPDFTEASTTVGRGRLQLEAGITVFNNKLAGVRTRSTTYPEALFRIGMFADWFELRLGQNFSSERVSTPGMPRVNTAGAQDFYLGCKLALTEQVEYLPEMAIILQTTLPTGAEQLTADQPLPGFNFLYGWNVTEFITMAGSFSLNRAIDGEGEYFGLVGHSFTVGYQLAPKLKGYTEVFALHPMSSNAPDNGSTYFFNGGFQYYFSNNLAVDIRAGVGLSRHSDDFYGVGFVRRY